jgi:hypothetical protein
VSCQVEKIDILRFWQFHAKSAKSRVKCRLYSIDLSEKNGTLVHFSKSTSSGYKQGRQAGSIDVPILIASIFVAATREY